MMVLCNASAIIEYDRIRSGLPSAPLDMEYDNSKFTKHINPILVTYAIIAMSSRWQNSRNERPLPVTLMTNCG